ncbi:PRELI domain-containing protein 1, mitochondrial [Cichlidogyrus casuarinus]|uniref:PRELI domain-containing protein 1, mitochondrial n=1 Tax=Cichlidogyrus casuarinus TaxID=1844966 RepID=A0ABD2PXF8_9PLAT
MKIEQILNYSWDFTTSLFWIRYPNPFAKHVRTEDVLDRQILPNGCLYTRRLISKKYMGSLPKWITSHLAKTTEFVVEETIIDTENKTFSQNTRNIGSAAKHAVLVEEVTMRPGEIGKTHISRKATVESNHSYAVRYPLQMFILHRYNGTAKSSFNGIDYICQLNDPKTTSIKIGKWSALKSKLLSRRSSLTAAFAETDADEEKN